MVALICSLVLISPVLGFFTTNQVKFKTANSVALWAEPSQRGSFLAADGDLASPLSECATSTPSRRSFLLAGSAAVLSTAQPAAAQEQKAAAVETLSENEQLMDVYFGCGCFWHVQHEFVEAERRILGRSDEALTARVGYAGGNAGAVRGKVCYHNARGVADYGQLGHAEVVALKLPPSKFQDFCMEYFRLFDEYGYRADQMGDRGPEYRNLVGFEGGAKSEVFCDQLAAACVESGQSEFMKLAVGKGDDEDARRVVFVMDSQKHPFYIGEQYHQFHDGFRRGENYPDSYNSLADFFAERGENFGSCPGRL